MSETLEEFLARGGEIKSLDMGYTAFPDGIIPMSPKPRKAKIEETPKAVIEKKNKGIRQLKPRKVQENRHRIPVEQVRALVKEQMQVLAEFYERMVRGDKKRLCEICGIANKTLDNAKAGNGRIGLERWQEVKKVISEFEFGQPKVKSTSRYKPKVTEGSIRRNQVTAARKIAEANGQKVFMAPCKHHGMTKYYLHGNQYPRCAECRLLITKNKVRQNKDAEQTDREERAKYNRERTLEAVKNGQSIFTGLCVRCGYAEMKYCKTPNSIIGYTYRCLVCTRKAQIKYNASRK